MRLFLMVPWVGLSFVIVVFPDHTHLRFIVSLSDDKQAGFIDVFNTTSRYFNYK